MSFEYKEREPMKSSGDIEKLSSRLSGTEEKKVITNNLNPSNKIKIKPLEKTRIT